MKTLFNRNTGIAAFAAVVIVGLTGLTLDRAHTGSLPAGTIEIGQLDAVLVGDVAFASLPAIEVIGARGAMRAGAAGLDDSQG